MGAAYNSQERSPAPRCLLGTQEEALKEIDAFIKAGPEGKRVCWLNGPTGSGKSTIAQTVAETYAERNQLAASFVFARTITGRNTLKHLFPTIAVQIAMSTPCQRQRLDEILNDDLYIAEREWGSVDLVASFFQDRSASAPFSPSLILIDGLNECQGHHDQCQIIAQVFDLVRVQHPRLRFLIVSSPESHIQDAFEEYDVAAVTKVISLYDDYGNHRASRDISMYLRSECSRIHHSRRHRYVMQFVSSPWPSDRIIKRLVRESGISFSHASEMIKFIDQQYSSPVVRLDQLLSTSVSSISFPGLNPFAELDQQYLQILSCYSSSQLSMLKHILGFVVMSSVLKFPFTSIELFLGLPPGHLKQTLGGLRSLVSFHAISDQPLLIHAPFGDFLLDEARAKDYYIDLEDRIHTTFRCAFSLACRLLCRLLKPHNCSSEPLNGQFLVSSSNIIKD